MSGERPAVEAAVKLASELGARRAIELPVSVAAHSPLMADAADGMRKFWPTFASTTRRRRSWPTATRGSLTTGTEARGELVEHLTAGVDWVRAVETMTAAGVDQFIEIGPGRVLTGLIKRIAPDVDARRHRRPDRALWPRPAGRRPPTSQPDLAQENHSCEPPTIPGASSSPALASSARSAMTGRRPGRTSSTASPGSARSPSSTCPAMSRRQPARSPTSSPATGWIPRRPGGARRRSTTGSPRRSRLWPIRGSRSPTRTGPKSGLSSGRGPAGSRS